MDRQLASNPLADVARSRRNPPRQVIESIAPENVAERREESPRRRRPRPQARAAAVVAEIPLKQLLSSRAALRRAIILSEIIGPPKALRRDD
ncbi:MAG TPA: hypothetical protein VMM78_01870 [Thermomicrobiales bacterium]|nr:hypothetical protein [Thermomicrobiales bacterium]